MALTLQFKMLQKYILKLKRKWLNELHIRHDKRSDVHLILNIIHFLKINPRIMTKRLSFFLAHVAAE